MRASQAMVKRRASNAETKIISARIKKLKLLVAIVGKDDKAVFKRGDSKNLMKPGLENSGTLTPASNCLKASIDWTNLQQRKSWSFNNSARASVQEILEDAE